MSHQPSLLPDEPPLEQAARDAERAVYLERLRAKLKDTAFRMVEGFPIGEDEAILALSDPPYYTACPNPFLPEIIARWQKERSDLQQSNHPTTQPPAYHREPFAADVSEGKNDPIYNAHSYHTKVPHKAIMRYILHYTDPGDIVLDGFCGTGMTGVAAQLCADANEVRALGYRVDDEGVIYDALPSPAGGRGDGGEGFSRLGARKAVLVDLSPAATFIAYNYNTPVDVAQFEREARRILREVEDECGWMYETMHTPSPHPSPVHGGGAGGEGVKGKISYTVWSEVFTCPQCSREVVFLDEALDAETKRVKDEFPCPHCGVSLSKRSLDKCRVTYFDPVLGHNVETLQRRPVRIEYTVGRTKHSKRLDADDLALLERIDALPIPVGLPTGKLPYMHMTHQRMRIANYGVTHLHHFFLPRARHALAALWDQANAIADPRLRAFMLFTVEQTIWTMSILDRYRPTGFSQVNQYLTGVYYISSLISEVSPWYILDGKVARLLKAFGGFRQPPGGVAISTQSVGADAVPPNSIDYIFTDPPFGENIYYADLNYVVVSSSITLEWNGIQCNPGKRDF
ncbi:MAG: hypothetical protein JW934_15340 [Anaerolineae bacterium]|nr:hypothetical protein [Anaerolineae bacterium]